MVKITVEVELAEHEIPLATELLTALRNISDTLRVRTAGAPAPATPAPAPQQQAAPRAAAPAPAPAPVAAAPPSAPGSPLQMQLTRCLGALAVAAADPRGDPSRLTLDASGELLRHLGLTLETAAALDTGRVAVVAGELVAAVCTLLNDPQIGQRLEQRTASVGPVVALGGLLPEPLRKAYFMELAKRVIVGLNTPRPLGAGRHSVFALAEVFARLIDVGHLPISGAVATICRLLQTPEKRVAAVTMLGKTVEVCFMQLSERCDAASLAELHAALRALREPEFQYDVEYVCECMGWKDNPPVAPAAAPAPVPVPAPAPAPQKQQQKQHQQKQQQQAPQQQQQAPPQQQQQQQRAAANGRTSPAVAPMPAEVAPREPSPAGYTGDTLTALQPVSSRACRSGQIYALAVDSARGETFVAVHTAAETEPDVTQVWNAAGLACEINMGSHLCSHLDVMRPVSVMLAATMSKTKPAGSCAVRCYAPSDGAWVEAGVLSRPDARPLAALRALPTTDGYSFALGDKHRPAGGTPQEVVAIFDLSASQSFSSLQPVQMFSGHTQLVTALEVAPLTPQLLLSGSKDTTVRLWDRRVPDGRGLVVAGPAATPGGAPLAHRDMITGIAVRDVSVLTGSMDGSVLQWDLRTIGGGPGASSQPVAAWMVDGKPVIRVALCQGAPCGAAATTHGLFALDVGGAALAGAHGAPPPAQRAAQLPAEALRTPGKYHCAAWDPAQGLLHAGWTTADASMAARLDTFRAVPP